MLSSCRDGLRKSKKEAAATHHKFLFPEVKNVKNHFFLLKKYVTVYHLKTVGKIQWDS
jgi:hypothetical protein